MGEIDNNVTAPIM